MRRAHACAHMLECCASKFNATDGSSMVGRPLDADDRFAPV